jgi:hypothetical protein
MVDLAALMVAGRTVVKIAEPDPHVVVDRTGDGGGNADAEDRMRHP